MHRQKTEATSSAATIATKAHVMFGPAFGATKPKKMPHGARTMKMVPSKLFQSVPTGNKELQLSLLHVFCDHCSRVKHRQRERISDLPTTKAPLNQAKCSPAFSPRRRLMLLVWFRSAVWSGIPVPNRRVILRQRPSRCYDKVLVLIATILSCLL